jgi:hypothetical protein
MQVLLLLLLLTELEAQPEPLGCWRQVGSCW